MPTAFGAVDRNLKILGKRVVGPTCSYYIIHGRSKQASKQANKHAHACAQ